MEIRTFTDQNVAVNQEVEVTAWYFRPKREQKRFKSFPKRMVWGGQEYTFAESGLNYLIQKGQELVQLFDMSDGQATYRLRQEAGHWTLVGLKSNL